MYPAEPLETTDRQSRRTIAIVNSVPRALDVDVVRGTSGATLTVGGDLDMATAPTLVTKGQRALEAGGGGELVIDLAGVDFCDSAGINALVKLRKLAEQHGFTLRVTSPRPAVRRVLDMTGISAHLNVAQAEPGR